MTLIVRVKAVDAVILAADSRGTIGDPRGLTAVNDTQQKLFKFGACGIAIAGASEMAMALLDEFTKHGLSQPADIDKAVTTLAKTGADLFDQWFRAIPPAERPGTLLLVGGYRTVGGKPTPMIYILNSQMHFAPQLAGAYPMMAGVPQYAVYLAHRYYNPAMNGDSAAALAEYLIAETASQDPKVGGPIQIAKIVPTGFEQLTATAVGALKKRNEKLNAKLKGFFVDGGKK